MTKEKAKIFGIGLSKTGTSSLTKALKILGYKAKHFPIKLLCSRNGKLSVNLNYAEKYEVMTDLPIARFYRELYYAYPNSKFILTTRDMEDWLDSCRRHFWPGQIFKGDNWINRLHQDVYNSIDFDRDSYKDAFRKHEDEVASFFENKTDKLLVMDITNGEGWKPLCDFLDRPIPQKQFPHIDCLYTRVFKMLSIQRFRK